MSNIIMFSLSEVYFFFFKLKMCYNKERNETLVDLQVVVSQ